MVYFLIQIMYILIEKLQSRVAQLVTCLAKDAYLTADPGVTSLVLARSHNFLEIDHEVISTSFSTLPLSHLRWVVVSDK